jgi:hypothetical protein
MSDDEVKGTDYLAKEVIDSGHGRPIGFIIKPRIRVQAISRKVTIENNAISKRPERQSRR